MAPTAVPMRQQRFWLACDAVHMTMVMVLCHAVHRTTMMVLSLCCAVLVTTVVVYRCYVTRTSLKCVAPGLSYGAGNFQTAQGNEIDRWAPDDDTRVCFQYSAIDSVPKDSAGYLTDDQLYAELVKDLKEYGAQDVQVSEILCFFP